MTTYINNERSEGILQVIQRNTPRAEKRVGKQVLPRTRRYDIGETEGIPHRKSKVRGVRH